MANNAELIFEDNNFKGTSLSIRRTGKLGCSVLAKQKLPVKSQRRVSHGNLRHT